MSWQQLHTDLAQTIALIWLGILLVGVVAWFVYRHWRRRHPIAPPAAEQSYSQRLGQRFSKGQGAAAKSKRRGGRERRQPGH